MNSECLDYQVLLLVLPSPLTMDVILDLNPHTERLFFLLLYLTDMEHCFSVYDCFCYGFHEFMEVYFSAGYC